MPTRQCLFRVQCIPNSLCPGDDPIWTLESLPGMRPPSCQAGPPVGSIDRRLFLYVPDQGRPAGWKGREWHCYLRNGRRLPLILTKKRTSAIRLCWLLFLARRYQSRRCVM